MRAQAAVEYVIILGIVLLVLIPIFYYSLSESNRTTRLNQASDIVNILARKSEAVYALGSGSRDYVWINVPQGIKDYSIYNKTIKLSFYSLGDAVAFSSVNVTGRIPVVAGVYRLVIEAKDNNVVVGLANDTTAPVVISVSPSGTVRVSDITLSVTTDEPAKCKYDITDKSYSSMLNFFDGSGISHTNSLSGLTNGDYKYYIRCVDNFGNVMISSSLIDFKVNLDLSPPSVSDTKVSPINLTAGSSICVNATITDNDAIDGAWVVINTPFNYPLPEELNYTLSDVGTCAGVAGDGIYGTSISLQSVGSWYINTSFASDISGNTGYQSPYPNSLVNVYSSSGIVGNAFDYRVPDLAWNFKISSGLGITARDNQSTLTLYTLDLSDDDKNTPPSSARFYYTSVGDRYEGYILQLNKTRNEFREYAIRVKTVDSEVLPYTLIVYAYSSDEQNIILDNATTFAMNNISVSGINRGFNEINVTKTVLTGKSNFVKLRIAPQNTMNGKVAHISEADIGVVI